MNYHNHKAFDSVKTQAIWESLKSRGVQPAYISLQQQCYTNCTTTITPFHKEVEIPITRGVSQGSPISVNFFSACLESVFNKLTWQNLKKATINCAEYEPMAKISRT
uniref:Reverse transcriptase domain-containing protein n=1 Tax=Caenorhabditis japonica TaxID=281687 RepID=A0A8R1E3Q6_CAEJA